MKSESGLITKQDEFDAAMAKDIKLMNSSLNSLNDLGVAPIGELTTITGPKGNGKSAFVKTILTEACTQNVKTLIILSEEKILQYKMPIAEVIRRVTDKDTANNKLSHLTFTTMIDYKKNELNIESIITYLTEMIKVKNIEFIIFDNFTTSFFGQQSPEKQAIAISKFRKLASDNNIGLLIVFHTIKGANPYERLLDGEDVRGNATSTNTAACNYVLTTFFKCSPPRAFLHIDKARYNSKLNKTYWELNFHNETGIYVEDIKVPSNLIEGLMKYLKQQAKDMVVTNNFK